MTLNIFVILRRSFPASFTCISNNRLLFDRQITSTMFIPQRRSFPPNLMAPPRKTSVVNTSGRKLRQRKVKDESENIESVSSHNRTKKPHKPAGASTENMPPKGGNAPKFLFDHDKSSKLVLRGFNPFGLHCNNLVYRIQHNTLGMTPDRRLRQAVVSSYAEQLSNYCILTTASPFDRRVTAMQWHPRRPNTLAVGSKGGDIILWNFTNIDGMSIMKGMGKGGQISQLHFDDDDPSFVYTSSIDGMIARQDFNGNNKTVLLNSTDWSINWYCSLDVNYKSNVIVAGDNLGTTTLMTRHGEKVWSHKLHKQKVTHCEFNKKCEWLLVTSGVDKQVKLWDIRKVSGRNSALYQLSHDKPINSAYFSPDSNRLLTTDQYGELRVYSGPLWDNMELSIAHPHRFYQHLTPMKATWHPIHDLIVVGRYPDTQFPGHSPGENRTIDLFDANTGDMACQLLDGSVSGIISLCLFNRTGDYLATGMGYNILMWTDMEKLLGPRENRSDTSIATGGRRNSVPNPSQRRRNRRNNDDDDVDKIKKKMKLKTKTQSKTKEKSSKSSER